MRSRGFLSDFAHRGRVALHDSTTPDQCKLVVAETELEMMRMMTMALVTVRSHTVCLSSR